MKAEIHLEGPVRFGSMYELQAVIQLADGTERTIQWSVHHQIPDALDYQARFNSHKGKAKKP